ncbi:HAD-IA family hydrolase [Candidatus Uhrbacteria bacterium]|nr:HAD-IA family hydrolase [Candidatus Uhrbacteria bacterium]
MNARDWVIWSDVGNVMAPFFLERYSVNLCRLTGMPQDLIKQRLWGLPSGERLHWGILTGEVKMDEYRRGVEMLLGTALPDHDFWPAFNDIFEPNPNLIQVYEHLRRTRQVKRIILMTDADPCRLKHSMKLCRFEPDDIVASYDIGRRKPDVAMFSKGIMLAASDPDRIVYLDDLQENVLAARELGVQSIHFLYDRLGLKDANEIAFGELRALGFSF